jgi:pSer/pThr/pTyr-binding forkhead associated (FHA) protein
MAAGEKDAGSTAYLVVRRDDGFGDVFLLTPGQTCTLGRAPGNRVVLKDDLCSRVHAEVAYAGGRWRVHDLNSTFGTKVNDKALNGGDHELAVCDEIHLGHTDLMFVEDLDQLPDLSLLPLFDAAGGDDADGDEDDDQLPDLPPLLPLPDAAGGDDDVESDEDDDQPTAAGGDDDAESKAYLVVRCDDSYGVAFPLKPRQTCTLGRAPTNRVVLRDDQCSRQHAEVAYVNGRWHVRDLSTNGTRVNGEALDGGERELAVGDDLHLGRTHLVFVENRNQLPDLPPPPDAAEGDDADGGEDDDQPTAIRVNAVRDALMHWMWRHGDTLRRPPVHSTPLLSFLKRLRIPETKWFGAMSKCCHYIEDLVVACLEVLLPLAGARAEPVVNKVAGGKSHDLLTLGQRVKILEELDADISRGFWRLPYVKTPSYAGAGEEPRLLGPEGVAVLRTLLQMRNDFAHGRCDKDQAEKEKFAQEFPQAVAWLCQSLLVNAARAVESRTEPEDFPTRLEQGQPPVEPEVPPGT